MEDLDHHLMRIFFPTIGRYGIGGRGAGCKSIKPSDKNVRSILGIKHTAPPQRIPRRLLEARIIRHPCRDGDVFCSAWCCCAEDGTRYQ
eukprot:scaffold191622_cov43-Prasinocladus_malaysianus.AAC.1